MGSQMPLQPSKSDLYFDQMLTDMSVAYKQDETEFTARDFFPTIRTNHSSGYYWVWDRGQWFRTDVKPRARGSESVGTGLSRSQANYSVKEYALHVDIADADIDDQDEGTDVEGASSRLLTRHMLIQGEVLFNTAYLTAGVWQGFKNASSALVDFQPAVDGLGYWDNDTSDPIRDIDKLKEQMHNRTGYYPNRLGMTSDVYNAVKNHPALIERIKYTQRGMITPELMASSLEMEKVTKFCTVLNSAQENQTDSMAPLQRNLFFLAYAPKEATKETPSAGYTFEWTGRFGQAAQGTAVYKIPLPVKRSQRYEVEAAYQYTQVCKDLGILGVSVLQH